MCQFRGGDPQLSYYGDPSKAEHAVDPYYIGGVSRRPLLYWGPFKIVLNTCVATKILSRLDEAQSVACCAQIPRAPHIGSLVTFDLQRMLSEVKPRRRGQVDASATDSSAMSGCTDLLKTTT